MRCPPPTAAWLRCKSGMPPDALDLEQVQALSDDAPVCAGTPDADVLQIIVGQYPCSTAWFNVPI